MQPRIGIPIPTSDDLAYNQTNWQAYADAIEASGGRPIAIPLDVSDLELSALLAASDGFVLPGSLHDVDPELYGHPRDAASASPDPLRERTDRRLLEFAASTTLPVLRICFGTQMLNVFHGGTLIQDLTVLPVNHRAGRSVAIAHTAAVEPGSMLAGILAPGEASPEAGFFRLGVNSSHHQAVGAPGADLKVVARCPQDGVVEAVELALNPGGAFVLGVQWHPERTFHSSPTSRALFARLIAEAGSGGARP